MNETIQTIISRRSIRRYQNIPVPESAIRQMLAAAAWAPSAHNRQPWRFAVIRQDDAKQRLARAMGNRLHADLAADKLPAPRIEKDVGRSYRRLTSAPVLILLSLSMSDMDRYPDAARRHNEWVTAVQSVALAGQNLLLAAHALGFGACWMCAPLFCPDAVRQTLALPSDWEPQALITLGYPAEQTEKTRQPLADKTIWIA
jgi:F420 biosynthesis protein FbiB-like protein